MRDLIWHLFVGFFDKFQVDSFADLYLQSIFYQFLNVSNDEFKYIENVFIPRVASKLINY